MPKKQKEELPKSRVDKLFDHYVRELKMAGQEEIITPPPGITFVDGLLAIIPVEPPLSEEEKLDMEGRLKAYQHVQSRRNSVFFLRLHAKGSRGMQEYFYALYDDPNFPMDRLMTHMDVEAQYAEPILAEMDEEVPLDADRFEGWLQSAEESRKHPERKYKVSVSDWEYYVRGTPKRSRGRLIYEFVRDHSVEAVECVNLLNAAFDKPCALVMNGQTGKCAVFCEDVTWNISSDQALKTASEDLDRRAYEMWMGLFERLENGKVLLYYFLRYARQERIPGVILAGVTGGGKSVITLLFSALKKNGANTTLFGSQYEDVGSTSLIVCEEYSPKKHQNMDVNVLKDIVTAKRFTARQIYSAETSVVGHRYLLLTDNWDNTPLFRMIGHRGYDEEALRNRIALFSFNKVTQDYLRNYPDVDNLIKWTTGQKRIDPRNFPFAVRFARMIADKEEELLGDTKRSMAKDGLASRTGVAAVSSVERGIHQSHSPIFIKAVKLYVDFILLKRNDGNEVNLTSDYTKFSVVGSRNEHQGKHMFCVSRRLRNHFDEALRSAGLKIYNMEHGDAFETILSEDLGGMMKRIQDESVWCYDGARGHMKKSLRYGWSMDLGQFIGWIRSGNMGETYRDISVDIARTHGVNPEDEWIEPYLT